MRSLDDHLSHFLAYKDQKWLKECVCICTHVVYGVTWPRFHRVGIDWGVQTPSCTARWKTCIHKPVCISNSLLPLIHGSSARLDIRSALLAKCNSVLLLRDLIHWGKNHSNRRGGCCFVLDYLDCILCVDIGFIPGILRLSWLINLILSMGFSNI